MEPDTTPSNWTDIAAYLFGDLSDADRLRFEARLAADPELRAAVASTQRGLAAIGTGLESPDQRVLDYSRRRLFDMLAPDASALERPRNDGSRLKSPRSRLGTAASRWALWSIALVVAVGAFIATRTSHVTPSAEARVYTTRAGEKATVRLAEGTQITLAPATTVQVHAESVTVQGAAYFQIAPRASRALVIRTRNAAIQVLGTRFTVRQYATESRSQIVVEEGRVALRSLFARQADGAPTVLTARMMGQVTDSVVLVTSGVAVADHAAWVQGRLVFNETPLRDVVTELTRAYGVTIGISDTSLARASVTFAVAVDREPLSMVLNEIGFVTGAHVKREHDTYVFVPGRSATQQSAPDQPLKRFPQPEKIYGR